VEFRPSWPQLIYLPYMAFLDGGVRHELGLSSRGIGDFINAVGRTSFSPVVGPPRGLEQLSGPVAFGGVRGVLGVPGDPAHARPARFNAFWEAARKEITGRPKGSAAANDAAGPIALGWRLATEKNPSAYAAMVYEKAPTSSRCFGC